MHDSSKPRLGFFAWICLLPTIVCCLAAQAWPDVVVISNRAGRTLDVAVDSNFGLDDAQIPPGDCLPFFTSGRPLVSIARSDAVLGEPPQTYELRPNAAHYLTESDGEISLEQIELGGTEFTLKPKPFNSEEPSVIIPVSIWTDDEQPLLREHWEAVLKKRVERAAEILARYSGARLHIDHVGCWESNDANRIFRNALLEFIAAVEPRDTLAIGFTSQHPESEPLVRPRLGGIRQPLSRHILIRESSGNISEAERLEVLVHELGHFLGAGHSVNAGSVMRPVLGDGLVRAARFQIRFDEVNTLAMSLMAEELHDLDWPRLRQLSAKTRTRMRQIYAQMAVRDPGDPLPPKYLSLFR